MLISLRHLQPRLLPLIRRNQRKRLSLRRTSVSTWKLRQRGRDRGVSFTLRYSNVFPADTVNCAQPLSYTSHLKKKEEAGRLIPRELCRTKAVRKCGDTPCFASRGGMPRWMEQQHEENMINIHVLRPVWTAAVSPASPDQGRCMWFCERAAHFCTTNTASNEPGVRWGDEEEDIFVINALLSTCCWGETADGLYSRGVPKYRYYDISRYFVLRYVIDTLVPNIDI